MTKTDLSQAKILMKLLINEENISYDKMKTLLKVICGKNYLNVNGDDFRFPVYISDRLKEIPIEILDLSVRGNNCLRRAGFDTMFDLLDKIEGKESFSKIRGCGAGTVQEIMEKIFVFQINSIKSEKKEKYIQRIIEINSNN